MAGTFRLRRAVAPAAATMMALCVDCDADAPKWARPLMVEGPPECADVFVAARNLAVPCELYSLPEDDCGVMQAFLAAAPEREFSWYATMALGDEAAAPLGREYEHRRHCILAYLAAADVTSISFFPGETQFDIARAAYEVMEPLCRTGMIEACVAFPIDCAGLTEAECVEDPICREGRGTRVDLERDCEQTHAFAMCGFIGGCDGSIHAYAAPDGSCWLLSDCDFSSDSAGWEFSDCASIFDRETGSTGLPACP